MLLFYEGVYVRCSEGTRKLVVKRSLSTCQPRSQCLSLPIYFLQSFWVQYFASTVDVPQATQCTLTEGLVFFIFRVGKSLACHSPGKWCLCA